MSERDALIAAAMDAYTKSAALCQCKDCRRAFAAFFARKDDEYLREYVTRTGRFDRRST